MIRQGDVLLIPAAPPRGAAPAVDESGRPLAGVRIAGERTGHAHELAGAVFDAPAGRFVRLDAPAPLTHPEHRHVTVPAGWWEVRVQREYVPAERPRNRYD